jgi:hypothetical protein
LALEACFEILGGSCPCVGCGCDVLKHESAICQDSQLKKKSMHLCLLLLIFILIPLLRFGLGDGGHPRLGPRRRRLVPSSVDESEISANDAALMLDRLPRSPLGDLLSDALLVHPTVNLGPCDLTWVFALHKERAVFGGGESEDLEGRS